MYAICLLSMGKFSFGVCLDNAWRIAKADNRTLHKVYRAVTAVFPVGVQDRFVSHHCNTYKNLPMALEKTVDSRNGGCYNDMRAQKWRIHARMLELADRHV